MTIFWDETQLDEQPEVLVEGDSWVSYWIPGNGNLVDRFDDAFDASRVILSLAYPGDEAIKMLDGANRWALEQSLKDYNQLKMIIFSGGGNDIAAKNLLPMLEPDCSKAKSVEDCFRDGQPEARLKQIEKAFRDLVTLRDTYRPDAVIITHNYDYALLGKKLMWIAWLDPYMQLAQVPKPFRAGIVARFIDGFADILTSLQGPGFEFVKTSGTLVASDWANELHPNRKGFRKIGKLFEPVLLKHLPND
jgi:lysophospholipase L1-like esterase